MNVRLRGIVNRTCYAKGKGQLLQLFTIIAIIGVELTILSSFYKKEAKKDLDFQYHKFLQIKDSFENEYEPDLSSQSSWIHGHKSRDFKDHLFTRGSRVNDNSVLPKIRSSCSQFNFSFSSSVLEPSFQVREKLLLLIFIISGVGKKSFLERRNAIRQTWLMRASNSKNWRHVFLLGRSDDPEINSETKREALFYNDVLMLNSTDCYENLMIKVFSGFRWAFLQVKPKFILKADDDVYVRVPLLIAWLNESAGENFYGGFLYGNGAPVRRFEDEENANAVAMDCYPEKRFPPYSAGPFYVISSNIVPSLFEGMRRWKVFPVEDAYIGVLANANNLKPVKIPGFHVNDNFKYHGNCLWASSIALGHHFDAPHMQYVERKLLEIEELALSRIYSYCLLQQAVKALGMAVLYVALAVTVIVAAVYISVIFRQYLEKLLHVSL